MQEILQMSIEHSFIFKTCPLITNFFKNNNNNFYATKLSSHNREKKRGGSKKGQKTWTMTRNQQLIMTGKQTYTPLSLQNFSPFYFTNSNWQWWPTVLRGILGVASIVMSGQIRWSRKRIGIEYYPPQYTKHSRDSPSYWYIHENV